VLGLGNPLLCLHVLALHIPSSYTTRQDQDKTKESAGPYPLLLSDVFSPSTISPSFFVCSPKRLSSNRLTRTLHPSLLQVHILPSRGPLHPRPAPLVMQVLLSRHVIDWGGGFDVLHIGLWNYLAYYQASSRQDKRTHHHPPLTTLSHC
jgi:hypothetical protein